MTDPAGPLTTDNQMRRSLGPRTATDGEMTDPLTTSCGPPDLLFLSGPIGTRGEDGPHLDVDGPIGVITGLCVSLKVAVCWEDGLRQPWVVGGAGTVCWSRRRR